MALVGVAAGAVARVGYTFALSHRGHGDADRPAAGYGPEDHAADVAAFMDAVGLDAAVIAGHSGGSYSAQRFALDHPERTLGIVLIDAFRAFHDSPEVLELGETVSELTDPVDAEFVRVFQESTMAQAIPAGFLETIVAESRKLPARVWKAYLEGFLQGDVPTETGTITAPTLILWGDQDASAHAATRLRSWRRSPRRSSSPTAAPATAARAHRRRGHRLCATRQARRARRADPRRVTRQ